MPEALPTKHFQRRAEDFVCAHCDAQIAGRDGYTNHCPQCLYSQHVDIHPGDRAAECGGMMEPVAIEPFGAIWKILQRCQRCGHERKNKTLAADRFEAILALQEKVNKKRFYAR
jgi:hypothetical protein